jgi:hypothetical protein
MAGVWIRPKIRKRPNGGVGGIVELREHDEALARVRVPKMIKPSRFRYAHAMMRLHLGARLPPRPLLAI